MLFCFLHFSVFLHPLYTKSASLEASGRGYAGGARRCRTTLCGSLCDTDTYELGGTMPCCVVQIYIQVQNQCKISRTTLCGCVGLTHMSQGVLEHCPTVLSRFLDSKSSTQSFRCILGRLTTPSPARRPGWNYVSHRKSVTSLAPNYQQLEKRLSHQIFLFLAKEG